MKKIIISLIAVVLCAGVSFAQDMAQATQSAQNAQAAFEAGDFAAAFDGFKEALIGAEAAGEEGTALVSSCKSAIPQILLSWAKSLAKDTDYDKAIGKLEEAVASAREYENETVGQKAGELFPQVMMQKANALLTSKDFAGAAEAYKAVTEVAPENGAAYLRLGSALSAIGKTDEAEAAFNSAIEKGQGAAAKKQAATMYLKQAAGALKSKNLSAAVAAAVKSNEYLESAQACQIAGQASQLLKKNEDAAKYFEKYLQIAPAAKNAGQIAYTLGVIYQQLGDKAKAKTYYQKASSDPTYGAEAAKQAASL